MTFQQPHFRTTKQLVVATLFASALVVSAGLGLATCQSASAMRQDGDTTAILAAITITGSAQTFGSTPTSDGTQTFGSSSSNTQTFGSSTAATEGTGPLNEEQIRSIAAIAEQLTSANAGKSPKQTKTIPAATQPATTVTTLTDDTPATDTTSDKTNADASDDTKVVATAAQTNGVVSPQAASTVAATAPLPHTGPSDVMGVFAGTGIVGFAGHKLYLRRKR